MDCTYTDNILPFGAGFSRKIGPALFLFAWMPGIVRGSLITVKENELCTK